MISSCLQCHADYETDNKKQQCCSRRCSQILRSVRWKEQRARTCKICGLVTNDLSKFVTDVLSLYGKRNMCWVCNRARTIKFTNKRKVALKEYIHDLKSKPCTDCGISYLPIVMDFDHVRGVKKFNIGRKVMQGFTNHQDVIDEIAKCELVCANCHRLRTYYRAQKQKGVQNA